MNPCFLFASGVGIESWNAFTFNLRTVTFILYSGRTHFKIYYMLGEDPFHCLFHARGGPFLSFNIRVGRTHFKLGRTHCIFGEDPLSVPYACVGIYIHMDVFYEAYYTCMLPYMRNIYNYLSVSFKHIVYFLECVRNPC